MPRPTLPPTPASSTDIAGKDGGKLDALHVVTLPPPAIADEDRTTSSAASSASASLCQPISPTSPVTSRSAKRRRSSSSQPRPPPQKENKEFNLPPPPTRERRIIQMRPRQKDEKATEQAAAEPPPPKESTKPAAKKKGGNGQSGASGHRTARKTAHSVIERRRRSKMNDEFQTLKDMIPACKDEDMHKLAILQASTEYLRYLERCVADLQKDRLSNTGSRTEISPIPKAAPSATPEIGSSLAAKPSTRHIATSRASLADVRSSSALSPSEDSPSFPSAANSHATSPLFSPLTYRPLSPSVSTSPSLLPLTSPDFSAASAAGSGKNIARDARLPVSAAHNPDLAHEATQALLMLTTDRRTSGGAADRGRPRGGMSVRELLDS